MQNRREARDADERGRVDQPIGEAPERHRLQTPRTAHGEAGANHVATHDRWQAEIRKESGGVSPQGHEPTDRRASALHQHAPLH